MQRRLADYDAGSILTPLDMIQNLVRRPPSESKGRMRSACRRLFRLLCSRTSNFIQPTAGFGFTQRKTLPTAERQNVEKLAEDVTNMLASATQLGVKIASGYEAGSPATHGNNAKELIALNNLGMSPIQVVRAATINAAELWDCRVT
jgi:imidazolonepropionase-like amidohydrolase